MLISNQQHYIDADVCIWENNNSFFWLHVNEEKNKYLLSIRIERSPSLLWLPLVTRIQWKNLIKYLRLERNVSIKIYVSKDRGSHSFTEQSAGTYRQQIISIRFRARNYPYDIHHMQENYVWRMTLKNWPIGRSQ